MSFLKKLFGAAPEKSVRKPDAGTPAGNSAESYRKTEAGARQIIRDFPGAHEDMFGRAVIPFGEYPQTFDGGKEAIMWIVLNPGSYGEDGGLFLLSEKILDCMRFHHDTSHGKEWPKGDIPRWAEPGEYLNTESDDRIPNIPEYYWKPEKRWPPDSNEYWKRSDIGKWLNGGAWIFDDLCTYPKNYRHDYFFDNAFSYEEQGRIIDGYGGKIFLLSLDEIRAYSNVLGQIKAGGTDYDLQAPRRALPTEYVKNTEIFRDECKLSFNSSGVVDKSRIKVSGAEFLPTGDVSKPCAQWWLRTRGEYYRSVLYVHAHGGIGIQGGKTSFDSHWLGVRPAMQVRTD